MAIGFWGWTHLVAFGLLLPWGAFLSRRRLARLLAVPRRQHFLSVILQQSVFAGFSLWVAWAEAVPLFPPIRPTALHLGLGLGFVAAGVLAMRPHWRDVVVRRDPKAHLFMPRTPGERRLWAGLSLAAGIGEELTYRGVLYLLLLRLTGEPLAAAGLAAAVFALSHVVQGALAALVTFGFALGFHALVLATGSLYMAMLAHTVYDLVAGYTYGRLGRELGYPEEGVAAPE